MYEFEATNSEKYDNLWFSLYIIIYTMFKLAIFYFHYL